MTDVLICLVLGLAAGILSGLVGIGGGIIVVPALVLLLGFSQHQAQGTTLALMVPPIGILAVWQYYQQGHVDVRIAALVCVGFVVGGWLGARWANELPELTLRRIFSVVMVLVGIKMFFGK